MIDFGAVRPPISILDEADPYARGVRRGSSRPARLAACWRIYAQLFAVGGLGDEQVRSAALASLAVVDDWAPDLAAEVRGTAAGAGLEVWQVAAINARTEILASARRDVEPARVRPGECSTVVSTARPAYGLQTWDWHVELADSWHLQSVATATGRFVGLTEEGMLAKIGVNDAGVAVHLNVLGHRGDRAGGAPVHLVAAQLLHHARSLDEAVELARQAPVSASSALTVLAEDGAATVELSPAGAAVLRTERPYLLHTNHFLDAALAAEERTELYRPDSDDRLAELQSRCAARFAPRGPRDLVDHLRSEPGDRAELCCLPDPRAPLGERWATLATVALDPHRRAIRVSPGTPAMAHADGWIALDCATAG